MDDVAEVKSRLEIAEVVGAYLPLKQAGRSLKAPCPFHTEKSASFTVSPERGIYHCFGCQESGDIFSFVMKMEGIEFREALEKLARQAGVELTRRQSDPAASKKRERMFEAHALAVKYFQATLVQNPNALEYVIKKRGLSRGTITDFGIGYAPDSWNALTDFLTRHGYTTQELLEGGLAGRKEGRSSIYDLFRGRITFPISDRDGRVIGFTARVLGDELPKYLNTPQTPLYDKSQAIYGLHLAREAIRAHDEVVLVEGNMDVVASHQVGVKQVVAASGTALTLEQLRILSKLTKNIKLAFDSDRAGLAATERAIELGQKLGLMLRMVVISEAKDADELIKKDPAAWERAIADAHYIIDYLFERFEQDFDLSSAIGKRQYVERLASNLRRLGDPVEQDHYVKLLATKTGTSEEAVRLKLAQSSNDNATSNRAKPVTSREIDHPDDVPTKNPSTGYVPVASRARLVTTGKPAIRDQLEEAVLALGVTYPLTRVALEDLSDHDFSTEERRKLRIALIGPHLHDDGSVVARALTEMTDYVNILMLRGEEQFADIAPADRSFEAFELTRRLQMVSNTDRKTKLHQQLQAAQSTGDVELELRLLTELQSIIQQEV